MTELIAYHEAGHALMAVLLGGRVKQVTIEPDNDDGPERQGDTQVLWRRSAESDKEFATKAVHVCLAGPVAEMIYSGDPYHPGFVAEWAADWQEAWAAAMLLHPGERQRLEYLEQISILLYHRLKEDDLWAALASLADNQTYSSGSLPVPGEGWGGASSTRLIFSTTSQMFSSNS